MSRPAAGDSVNRILAMVPWVAARPGGVPLDELCERFRVTPRQLVSDLELLSFVGPAPRTFDTLVEVSIDDGWVVIRPQWFDRPLRLTSMQALALVAAGEAASDLPGSDPDGPLARGLRKLADALGVEPGTDLDIELGQADHLVVNRISEAAQRQRRVRIRYHGLDSDVETERVVEPWAVSPHSGAWAMVGWCHLREDRRWFRLDRITDLEVLDDEATVERQTEDTSWSPPSTFPAVRLRIAPARAWAAERWPVDSYETLADGSVEVTVRLGGPGWLERVTAQLGADLVVVDDPGGLAPDRADLAERLLARYRGSPSDGPS
jgi:proteasome accessory factor C